MAGREIPAAAGNMAGNFDKLCEGERNNLYQYKEKDLPDYHKSV